MFFDFSPPTKIRNKDVHLYLIKVRGDDITPTPITDYLRYELIVVSNQIKSSCSKYRHFCSQKIDIFVPKLDIFVPNRYILSENC